MVNELGAEDRREEALDNDCEEINVELYQFSRLSMKKGRRGCFLPPKARHCEGDMSYIGTEGNMEINQMAYLNKR